MKNKIFPVVMYSTIKYKVHVNTRSGNTISLK